MENDNSAHVTRLLHDLNRGHRNALDELLPLVYEELKRIAGKHLKRQPRREHTLQTTALVHEAYLKMVNQTDASWENRVHFFAAAARVMRHILIDYARALSSEKRGGEFIKLSLDEAYHLSGERQAELIALDDALKILAEMDEQKAKIVEMRYFGGMSNEEIAAALGIGTATVTRAWRTAKAWLQTQIQP
jgi:RNA polymerase sigma-70 factor, ECF subfamily